MSIDSIVNKPVTTIIVFTLTIMLGIYCTFNLKVDMFPDMDIPYVITITEYENAGPEEVEQSLTRTLESSLSGLTGLKKLQSHSQTGLSLIIMEMEYGTNLENVCNDVRDKIDQVRTYLPDDADTPITIRLDPSMMPVMNIAVMGDRSPEELRTYAEDVIQPRLEQLDGVASAYIMGGRERSINIDLPRDRLDAYSLSISEIAQMVGAQNIDAAGGQITTGETNYSVKTQGKFLNVDDIRDTVISYAMTSSDGVNQSTTSSVLLRDIADVYSGYKDQTTVAYLDGKPNIMFRVQKQSGKNSVTTAHNIRKQMPKIEASIPRDIRLMEVSNSTDDIEDTIAEVAKSVVEGALLAIAVLLLFLRSLRSTLIVGLSIPIATCITLFCMYFLNMSLNLISLSGLLLGIGMLVDNSIVVLENIFTYRERDAKYKVAAVLGTKEMINSVTASTLTSVCIFLPMLMLKAKLGMMGQMFNDMALTIILSLMCSLITAVVLVPVLASSVMKVDSVSESSSDTFLGKISYALGRMLSKMDNGYANMVRRVLRHKFIVLASVFVLFVAAFLTVPKLGFVFVPESVGTDLTLKFVLPKGTRIEVTEAMVQEMEDIARQTLQGIKFTIVSAGGSSMMASSADTNEGELQIQFYTQKERQKGWDNDQTAKRKLMPYLDRFPGADITFDTGNSTGNSGISIDISSNDLDMVNNVSKQVVELMKTKGKELLGEVTRDLQDGLPEITVKLDRAKMYELGVNVHTIGTEINGAINGLTATRYQDAGKDIDVIVRFAEEDRQKARDLDQIFVKNVKGQRIPLSNFATVEETMGPVTIYRENQSRIAHVTCKQAPGVPLDKAMSGIKKIVDENILIEGDLNIQYSGDFEDMMEAVQNFGVVIIMAMILVFSVMASQFESLKGPFIILFTIPLAIIGVATIYLLSGNPFSIMSVIGVLMLVGTIVNNGIVLVDQTGMYRERGMALEEACVEAAGNRLRPILMSTLTTILSLMPLAFFPGEGMEAMQPVGLTVFGGLTFGSTMTLFVMPIIYSIFNKRNEAKKVARQEQIERDNANRYGGDGNKNKAETGKGASGNYDGIKGITYSEQKGGAPDKSKGKAQSKTLKLQTKEEREEAKAQAKVSKAQERDIDSIPIPRPKMRIEREMEEARAKAKVQGEAKGSKAEKSAGEVALNTASAPVDGAAGAQGKRSKQNASIAAVSNKNAAFDDKYDDLFEEVFQTLESQGDANETASRPALRKGKPQQSNEDALMELIDAYSDKKGKKGKRAKDSMDSSGKKNKKSKGGKKAETSAARGE